MFRRHCAIVFINILVASCAFAQGLVISQVYGGGGNSGATYTHDFIEIFNAGSVPAALNGLSVQYASATGTGNFGATNTQITELPNVTLQPGQYYLIQEAQGTGGTTALPAPDLVDATPINMSGTGGKVVLANTAVSLGCNGSSTACSAAQLALIIDLVGYGNANFFEGAGATTATTNTTGAMRNGAGCTDTNNNSADFTIAAPAPRNTATALNTCSGGGSTLTITTASPLPAATVGAPYSVTFQATGGTNAGYTFSATGVLPSGLLLSGATLSGIATQASASTSASISVTDSGGSTASKTFALTINGPAQTTECQPTHRISEIQGSGTATPVALGTGVITRGIVTALVSSGFFIQSATADADASANTSEGLFVFTSSAPPAAAVTGNLVCVVGAVAEFGRTASPRTVTELTRPTLWAVATGQTLPAPVLFSGAQTDPSGTTDQYEKHEGMRLSLAPLLVTGPASANVTEASNTATGNGRFYGVLTGAQTVREPGMLVTDPLAASNPTIPKFDGNPEVFSIESAAQTGATLLNPDNTATVTGITGVLHYDFGEWKIYPDPSPVPVLSGGKLVTPAQPAGASEGTVATLNFERFFDTNDDPTKSDAVLTPAAYQGRLAKASKLIREVMQSPDIIASVEVENLATLQDIANKLNADSSPLTPGYAAYLVEGNDVGGIDVGFLVKSSRVTVNTVVQEGKNDLFVGYGSETLNDRPPLVLTGSIKKSGALSGLGLTVIAVHQRSLGDVSSNNADGVRAREKRRQQAVFLANLIQARQTANPAERIVVAGDFNAYQFSDGYLDVVGGIRGVPTSDPVLIPVADLVNPDLLNPLSLRPAAEQYSYNFAGNIQALDHILVNSPANAKLTGFSHGRVNSDFAESNRGDTTTAKRLSDHDPAVAYFSLPEATDVSSQVTITRAGLLFNRTLNAFTQSVTVKNTSAQALAGPVSVAAGALPAGVTLANAAGSTPAGEPYVVMTAGALAPGASATQTFQFTRTGTQSITWTPKAIAGAF